MVRFTAAQAAVKAFNHASGPTCRESAAVAGGCRCQNESLAASLLKWALISLVAALFGFAGISAAPADIARLLFHIFWVIFIVLLLLGLTLFRP